MDDSLEATDIPIKEFPPRVVKRSKRFLKSVISKLKTRDWEKDTCLIGFYNALLQEKKNNPETSVFQYYLEYLIRNDSRIMAAEEKKEHANIKSKRIDELCVEIYDATMNPKDEPELAEFVTKKDLRKAPTKDSSKKFIKSEIKEVLDDDMPQRMRHIYDLHDDGTKTLLRVEPIMSNARSDKALKRKRKVYAIKTVTVKTTSGKKKKKKKKILVRTELIIEDPPITKKKSAKKSAGKPTVSSNGKTKKITMNKQQFLQVLSKFIKYSNIAEMENPQENNGKMDEEFRERGVEVITDHIIKERGKMPIAKKDADFGRKNKLLDVWQETEAKCKMFIKTDKMARVIKKFYFIDGTDLKTDQNCCIETMSGSEILEDTQADNLPVEELKSSWLNTQHRTRVTVLNSHPMTEAMNRMRNKIKVVYVPTASRMIPGGGSDQGIETGETSLYYSSSYYMCVSELSDFYPLEHHWIIYCPSVLVFKDHTKDRYPMLDPRHGGTLPIIIAGTPYQPKNNITDQDKYTVDSRLYDKRTKLTDPKEFVDQLTNIFNAALFFGHDVVILDDRGVNDFWLPAHHVAKIMQSVINKFRNNFSEIVIAIKNKHLYGIFQKYIH